MDQVTPEKMLGHTYADLLKEEEETPSSQTMKESLHNYVVEELQTLIYDDVHRNCEGCKVDHPSQTRHTLCLFTHTDDWVEFYIDSALERLDLYKVMEHWYPELQHRTQSEKNHAYRMWSNIKRDFELNPTFDRDVWAERVKQAWRHGHC